MYGEVIMRFHFWRSFILLHNFSWNIFLETFMSQIIQAVYWTLICWWVHLHIPVIILKSIIQPEFWARDFISLSWKRQQISLFCFRVAGNLLCIKFLNLGNLHFNWGNKNTVYCIIILSTMIFMCWIMEWNL